MTKYCPSCIPGLQMILFDSKGESPEYGPEAEIDWEFWPFPFAPPPNTWACPRCGHHEAVGMDVQAQMEERPRLL